MVTLEPEAYGAWFETALGRRVWADERRAVVALLQPLGGWRILEAGCGNGRLAATLASQGIRVIGVDASGDMLRAAARRSRDAGAPVDLVRADVGALPFPNGSLDAVTAVTVLCFLNEPIAALRELARVVRPGGRVVVGELGRWSLWAAQRRLAARRHGGLWSAARFWSKRSLSSALRTLGLIPRVVRGAVFYPKSLAAAKLLRSLDPLLGRITTVGAAFVAVAADKPIPAARPGRQPVAP